MTINTFLPSIIKFFYPCSIKIHILGFDKLLESIFCLLLFVEAFSPQKLMEMLEEVVVDWQEIKWIWQMRQNFEAQFIQLLKCLFCNLQPGIFMEKNWVLSVDLCQLQALQFLAHLIDLLSRLLRCNGFTGIQKAVVDQSGSKPPHTDHDLFLFQVWLWEMLWSFFLVQPLSWSSPVV